MKTALAVSIEATARGASFGDTGVDTLGSVGPHRAALNARSVAGDVVSPGIGLVNVCGVLGV